MAKVTQANPQDLLHASTITMIRGPILHMLEEWGFQRPDRLDFEYSVTRQAIQMRMRYSKFYVDYLFDDSPAGMEIAALAEQLAQDARIPIAESL